ncbi:MAG: hypothetical protein CM15mP51_25250 [Porticoccaceae bacterium]|nr:MAG: hypothetical protein CM15mP51_25250 [Porticoccaceae bacterium]
MEFWGAAGAILNDGTKMQGPVGVFFSFGNSWVQIGADIDGESLGDRFGASVSLSDDGKTLGGRING